MTLFQPPKDRHLLSIKPLAFVFVLFNGATYKERGDWTSLLSFNLRQLPPHDIASRLSSMREKAVDRCYVGCVSLSRGNSNWSLPVVKGGRRRLLLSCLSPRDSGLRGRPWLAADEETSRALRNRARDVPDGD
jgi:hypothetical protein